MQLDEVVVALLEDRNEPEAHHRDNGQKRLQINQRLARGVSRNVAQPCTAPAVAMTVSTSRAAVTPGPRNRNPIQSRIGMTRNAPREAIFPLRCAKPASAPAASTSNTARTAISGVCDPRSRMTLRSAHTKTSGAKMRTPTPIAQPPLQPYAAELRRREHSGHRFGPPRRPPPQHRQHDRGHRCETEKIFQWRNAIPPPQNRRIHSAESQGTAALAAAITNAGSKPCAGLRCRKTKNRSDSPSANSKTPPRPRDGRRA